MVYYVFNKGKGAPIVSHKTLDLAIAEAKRLSAKEQCYFEVVKKVAIVEPIVSYNITFTSEAD